MEANENKNKEVGTKDKTISIEKNDSDEHKLQSDQIEKLFPHNEPISSGNELENEKTDKSHEVIMLITSADNVNDNECEKRSKLKNVKCLAKNAEIDRAKNLLPNKHFDMRNQ